jgi:hypothetical protein
MIATAGSLLTSSGPARKTAAKARRFQHSIYSRDRALEEEATTHSDTENG